MRFSLILIFGLALLLAVPVSATIINVPADQSSIQAGINASVNGDTVVVQSGTYVENINFNGKNIVVGSLFMTTDDPSYIQSTVIDGSGSGVVVSITANEDNTSALIGFTIQNGIASTYGGGVYCYNSDPLISHNRIINNTAASGGGICCNYNSAATLIGNFISGNMASSTGGGLFCRQNSNIVFDSNTVVGNSAPNAGGIYCWGTSAPNMNHNTITGNSADTHGGGIYSYNSSPAVSNSIIWNNTAGSGTNEIHHYGGGTPSYDYCDIGGEIWPGTGNISCDPYFCEHVSGNYLVDERSCCVGAGDGGANIGALGVGCGPKTINVPEDYSLIQAAIDASIDGDTVLVQSGYYVENINFNGKNIVLGSLFLTTGDTSHISLTSIHGFLTGSVVTFGNGENITAAIYGFTIEDGISSLGGGIQCFNNSSPTISHNRITGNIANFRGGGIYCGYHSDPNINNNRICFNSATIGGGGIFMEDSANPIITNNIIYENSCNGHGAGVLVYSPSSPTIINNRIYGNNCDGSGGGLFGDFSYATITGNLIAQNSANNGGGIYFTYGPPASAFSNNTIFNNTAQNSGGGIYYNSPTQADFINSILWANSALEGDEVFIERGSLTFSYSDIQGSIWPGDGNISCDPMLCDPNNGDFYLDAASCCVGVGQDGVDIGAYGVGCGEPVPILSEWGMILLSLLLIAGGTIATIRRDAFAPYSIGKQ